MPEAGCRRRDGVRRSLASTASLAGRADPRPFSNRLPPLAYPDGLALRRVQEDGRISFGNRALVVSQSFAGVFVGLKPTAEDDVFDVLYVGFVIDKFDCTRPG